MFVFDCILKNMWTVKISYLALCQKTSEQVLSLSKQQERKWHHLSIRDHTPIFKNFQQSRPSLNFIFTSNFQNLCVDSEGVRDINVKLTTFTWLAVQHWSVTECQKHTLPVLRFHAHLVYFSERSISQLSNNIPLMTRIDISCNVFISRFSPSCFFPSKFEEFSEAV